MRHDSIELEFTNRRTRRVWYGHGSSRLIAENGRDMPPADVIDEAMARFERGDVATTIEPSADVAPNRRPFKNSFVADVAAQLATLDRQRHRLARLLRDVNDVPFSK